MKVFLGNFALIGVIVLLTSSCKPIQRQGGSEVSAARSKDGTLLWMLPGSSNGGLCLLTSRSKPESDSRLEDSKLLTVKGGLSEQQVLEAISNRGHGWMFAVGSPRYTLALLGVGGMMHMLGGMMYMYDDEQRRIADSYTYP
ncbi:MAG: hypothetical protein OYH77_02095, partial [Pseudomonadota bacterium]|nr:hypothetical protein [Pseudomonadota bacterium]